MNITAAPSVARPLTAPVPPSPRAFTTDELIGAVDMPVPERAVVEEATSAPYRISTILVIILPFLALIGAGFTLWGTAFNWMYLALLFGMYMITGLGITVGYHRLFTHKSFDAPAPVRAAFAVAGSFAIEGPVIDWVAWHRRHHQHSDEEHDPHSPHTENGEGVVGMLKGLYHAHMGWLTRMGDPEPARYAPDLLKDPVARVASKLFFPLFLAGLLIPGVIAGLITMTWTGFGLGVLWGGLVRVFVVHHITWSINSVCHMWGSRDYVSHDHSRNNIVFGILGFGEGWHNNHHAFPTSARHGLRWWQFDSSWLVIRTLSLLGLAKDIRLPSPERLAAKARKQTAGSPRPTSTPPSPSQS